MGFFSKEIFTISKNKLRVTAAIIVGWLCSKYTAWQEDECQAWTWEEMVEISGVYVWQLMLAWAVGRRQSEASPAVVTVASTSEIPCNSSHSIWADTRLKTKTPTRGTRIFKITWMHVQLDQRKKKTAAILRTRLMAMMVVWADPRPAHKCMFNFLNCSHEMQEVHMRCFGGEVLGGRMYRLRSLLEAWALEAGVAQTAGSADKARLCVETKTFWCSHSSFMTIIV